MPPESMVWTLGFLLVTAAGGAAAAASSSGGLSYESDNGDYSFSLGGRLMWDADSFDGVLNLHNEGERRFNSQLRRARLELSGKLPGDFDWVFDINYLDDSNDTEIHAAGLRYTGWSFAEVFVGRTKEPFGLEELTSSKAISTIRRSLLTEATDADSQPHYGIRLDGFVGPVGWSAGVFNPGGNPRNEDGGDRIALTGRLFGAPILDGDRVLHLGASYTDRNLDQAEELTGFALRIAESGERTPADALLAREDRQAGLEALYLNGPWSLQGEYFRRDLEGAGAGPHGEVVSYYVQGTWTVTGESRGYKRADGIPGMVEPKAGRGAVELVARYEDIDFDNDTGASQQARVYLAGINWYPNRNVKVMFNVSQVDTSALVAAARDDDGLALSGRIQLAF